MIYWNANSVRVENPIPGALEAQLIVPIPGFAARVSGLGVVELREDTGTFDKIVALEARGTETSGIIRLALITDSDTKTVSIKSEAI